MTRRRPSGRPVGRPGVPTRERILDATEALVARRGVEGLRLKDVAAATGIRTPSIFAHFEGRDAVLKGVADRLAAEIAAIFQDDPTEAPERVIRRWVRELVRHLARHPAQLRILLRDLAEAGSPGVERSPTAKRVMDDLERRVASLLRRGRAAGSFRRVRAQGCHAQVFGAVLANLAWGGWDEHGSPIIGTPVRLIAREAEEFALRYLAARGPSLEG